MKVCVASQNKIKVGAVSEAFGSVFDKTDEIAFETCSVASGVSDQPMDNAETLEGAYNRALNAQNENAGYDYYVGIEGGLEKIGGQLYAFAWVVIRNDKKRIGKARTAGFLLPPKVTELIAQGKELGEADDIVFGMSNTKQSVGASGLLTKGLISRQELYRPAVIMALIPFINTDLFTADLGDVFKTILAQS